MTKTAYFDCFSGVAGDMILGALVDSGLSVEKLAEGLRGLRLEGYRLEASKVRRNGINGTKVDVVIEATGSPFSSPDKMAALIADSALPEAVRRDAVAVVRKLEAAEAAVHGGHHGHVMFHEIGAIDTIVDVTGSVLGLHMLGVSEVLSSAVAVGTGFVATAHGLMPVPPPASAEILKGIPTRAVDVEGEIATPTGCAILATLSRGFGPMPSMTYDALGYGAGDRKFEGRPNLLRVFVGERAEAGADSEVELLETNVDDVSGEVLGQVFAKLMAAGALDVWAVPSVTKKNRPAHVVSVLAPAAAALEIERALFAETGTFGIRRRTVHRSVLARRFETVETKWGKVRIKVGRIQGGGEVRAPEFEDCLALAAAAGVPVRVVLAAAARA